MYIRICRKIRSHVSTKSEIFKTCQLQKLFLVKMERIGKGSKPSKENGVTVQLKELSPSTDVTTPTTAVLAYISSLAHVCLVDDMVGQCDMNCVCSKAAHKQLATEDPEKRTLCMQQHAPVKVKYGNAPSSGVFYHHGAEVFNFFGEENHVRPQNLCMYCSSTEIS